MTPIAKTFFVATLPVFIGLLSGTGARGADDSATVQSIYDATGITGGLVVHLGCRDGTLTTQLHVEDRILVHGLDRDAALVEKARKRIGTERLYGKVSADVLTGRRLPYADQLVNLVVADQPDIVEAKEIMRVLRPGGVAYVKHDNEWTKTIKAWPKDIDEWTHFLHGPDNNAVAKDMRVGPPEHVQWIGGPKWARGHEVLATISAVVTAGGRIYYIADEGPVSSVDLPSKWVLVARDAFNGVLLWKRPIPKWESTHRPFRSGPTHLPRRLTAIGDTVYVTLGLGEPLVALDASTGEVAKTYQGTEGTEEIIFEDNTLYLVVGDTRDQKAADRAVRRGSPLPMVKKRIMAISSVDGKLVWKKSDDDLADLFSQTLAISGGRAFLQNTREVICLDASSGSELWRTKRPASLKRPAWSVPTLVVHGDIVISADRQAPADPPTSPGPQKVDWTVSFAGGNAPQGDLIALAAATGERLWNSKCREGYNSPVDVLLADGLLWTGDLVKARDPGITEALDPKTGEVKRTRPNDQVFFTPGMSHHRCYRNRATERFIVLGRSGIELLDVKTGKASANHWVRGTCQFGVLPANGMIYAPPHTCACYIKTKLNGFNALAPKRETNDAQPEPALQRGPAYAAVSEAKSKHQKHDPDTWPTYRHDAERSGATSAAVAAKLKPAWQTNIGGELSSVVVADERVFVARVDSHEVHALSADDGKTSWTFSAGGPIDSPPTVHRGLVLFGSADGWLYCLQASDGELAWRFRAGPEERRIVVDGILESAWPIHGSVLVQNERVYFAAGRSSFLDGGILVYALDPFTGDVVAQTRFSGRDPKSGEQPKGIIKGFDMPGGLADVLSSDGNYIYMRDSKFDEQCVKQAAGGRHLFSPTGFLDDSWWHRSYWIYGSDFAAGWGGWHKAGNTLPAGRLLVFNDESIYGFGRNVYPRGNAGQWRTGEYYRLFAAAKDLKSTAAQPVPKKPAGKKRRGKSAPKYAVDFHWSQRIEPVVRAMVLADKLLFVAGPHGETHRSQAALEGREGISLQVISTEDGSVKSSYPLSSLPVFDGLASAYNRLYLASEDGNVVCYQGAK